MRKQDCDSSRTRTNNPGHVGPVVVCLSADQEVYSSNPTLAKREFLRAQEMNHRGSILPICEFGTLRELCLCKFDIPGHRMMAAN